MTDAGAHGMSRNGEVSGDLGGASHRTAFRTMLRSVGRFDLGGRTLLIPDMAPNQSRLLAAAFRAFGVDAHVMETYTGLALGKEFTSGKECFPCQVTLGDILHHLNGEKARLGASFDARSYVYFLPEADGPCRFGMYNKLQRLVLDRFPEFREIPIAYLSTADSYSLAGLLPKARARSFRKLAYVATVLGDALDRILWRARPYERVPGAVEALVSRALAALEEVIEREGASLPFSRLIGLVEAAARAARDVADTCAQRRPIIGAVGEIYLRSHTASNQDLARQIEGFGGEMVIASIGEWINYITYDQVRVLKRRAREAWRAGDHGTLRRTLPALCSQLAEEAWQIFWQTRIYRSVRRILDIAPEHSIREVERQLDGDRLFSFDVGTEAALSIGGALVYAHHGYNGIVNVYPFTCMPSTMASAVLKPLLHEMRLPYLDAAYDGSIQPNREAALRTFIYQAEQHRDTRRAAPRTHA